MSRGQPSLSPLTFKSSQYVWDAPRDCVPPPLKPPFRSSLFSLLSWLLASYLGWPYGPGLGTSEHRLAKHLSDINYRGLKRNKRPWSGPRDTYVRYRGRRVNKHANKNHWLKITRYFKMQFVAMSTVGYVLGRWPRVTYFAITKCNRLINRGPADITRGQRWKSR